MGGEGEEGEAEAGRERRKWYNRDKQVIDAPQALHCRGSAQTMAICFCLDEETRPSLSRFLFTTLSASSLGSSSSSSSSLNPLDSGSSSRSSRNSENCRRGVSSRELVGRSFVFVARGTILCSNVG